MTFIFLGVYPVSDIDNLVYVGEHDPFSLLATDPNAELQYLVELYPFNENKSSVLGNVNIFPGVLALGDYMLNYSGGEDKQRLSEKGFSTTPYDSEPNRIFLGRVTNPLQFDTNILSGDSFSGGSQSYGGLEIINADGKLDKYFDYHWSGRRVVVKAGGLNFAYDDFATIFEGSISNIEGDDPRILMTLQDNRLKTNKPIVSGTYGGTGGLDGMTTLKDVRKPLSFGVLKNIAPVLIDYANQIYQLHDGAVISIDAVRDRGIELDYGGSVSDINTATPTASQYMTQLTGGYIKLGSTPAGQITADVHGETNAGSSNMAMLAIKILKSRLGVFSLSSTDIDEGSFSRLALVLDGDAGLYINNDITGSDVLDALFNNSGAYWTFTRQGMLYAGSIASPDTSIGEIKYIDYDGVQIQTTIPPAWRIKVGYAPTTTIQTENDLAGGVTNDVLSFVTEPYRYVVYENENVRLKNTQATERSFDTLLANKSDAENLLERLVAIYAVKRIVYKVIVYKTLYRYFLGDTVTLKYDRYGLDNGKNLMVVGVSENAATGQTVLSLWG